MNKRKIGGCYEEMAAVYLQKMGYRVLERNYRCARGEVDLICKDGGYLVFVEVKYRTDSHMGSPLEAVDQRKQSHIRAAAMYYLYSHGMKEDCACRFDVVGILGDRIELVRDAF